MAGNPRGFVFSNLGNKAFISLKCSSNKTRECLSLDIPTVAQWCRAGKGQHRHLWMDPWEIQALGGTWRVPELAEDSDMKMLLHCDSRDIPITCPWKGRHFLGKGIALDKG